VIRAVLHFDIMKSTLNNILQGRKSMLQENNHQNLDEETSETRWRGLYRVAGVGVLIAVAFMLLDIGLSFAGGDVEVGGISAVEWFAYIQNSWFLGLRNLGFFNVINTALTIPLYLALFWLHRKAAPAFAALALILFVFGAAVYTANNRALSMLELSDQYSALPAALPASSQADIQRGLLAAAGTVILAQAEDLTPGTFVGFFVINTASILMMVVILQGKVFRRWIALVGLAGSVFMQFFTIIATFIPTIFDLAMVFALLGGLLMMAWNISMAIGMFRMSGVPSNGSQALSTQLATTGKGV